MMGSLTQFYGLMEHFDRCIVSGAELKVPVLSLYQISLSSSFPSNTNRSSSDTVFAVAISEVALSRDSLTKHASMTAVYMFISIHFMQNTFNFRNISCLLKRMY